MNRTEVMDRKARRIVPIKWKIEGHEHYGFATNKRCYNLTTGFEGRQFVKGGYSSGYNLSGQFYSLAKLRPLLKLVLSLA